MPLNRLDCVSAYVEGWRDVVVLSHGHRWLTGFTAATLDRVVLPADTPVRPLPYPRTRLLRRLRRNAKSFQPSKSVSKAIAELGKPSRGA